MKPDSTSSHSKWIVHKFGGTSVLNADRYTGVSRILENERLKHPAKRQAVVVSAMKGTTDALIELVALARLKDPDYLNKALAIKQRHLEAARALGLEGVVERLEKDFNDLGEVIRGVFVAGSASETIVEWVSGHGEIWSALLLSALLKKQGKLAHYLDARGVLVVDSFEKSVSVHWGESEQKLQAWLKENETSDETTVLVITGFVASNTDGVATTLKRNGSDFSASIFGRLLDALEIVIWTDVDGVLSADPRLVPEAVFLSEMTYHEVTELANFGAKVVHPATMEPAIRKGIPVWIRNTFNPDFPGTKIHAGAKSDSTVKGFSAIEKMALINVEGTGLVGVSGVAERIFGALRASQISAVLISQACSEQSICFAIPEDQAGIAKMAVEKAFFAEIHQGALDQVRVLKGKSILAAVGDNMVEHPGVAGRFFSALGQAGVNIHAIAQGASERNISAVIDGKDSSRALRAVHSAFYQSRPAVGIGLIGAGLIGSAFLKQLQNALHRLKHENGVEVRLLGILNRKAMLLDSKEGRGLSPETWLNFESGEAPDQKQFLERIRDAQVSARVIIDATASETLPQEYLNWLKEGFHVITPNKKANSGAYRSYLELQNAAKAFKRKFLYSTNVGGGLPILQTIKELIQTGDRILAVEGVLSGTLSFLLNQFDGSKPFSQAVLDAKALGYTEPDPRDDLSGLDVARKLVILAREAGVPLELSQVQIEGLIPPSLLGIPLEDYLKRLPEGDLKMQSRVKEASAQNQVLRYVGKLHESGQATVRLEAYPRDHAFASLKGADNSVLLNTVRYSSRPLVIQGPGAGAEVTAAGVFADLLRVLHSLGAPS